MALHTFSEGHPGVTGHTPRLVILTCEWPLMPRCQRQVPLGGREDLGAHNGGGRKGRGLGRNLQRSGRWGGSGGMHPAWTRRGCMVGVAMLAIAPIHIARPLDSSRQQGCSWQVPRQRLVVNQQRWIGRCRGIATTTRLPLMFGSQTPISFVPRGTCFWLRVGRWVSPGGGGGGSLWLRNSRIRSRISVSRPPGSSVTGRPLAANRRPRVVTGPTVTPTKQHHVTGSCCQCRANTTPKWYAPQCPMGRSKSQTPSTQR